jgi:hypothetical protein
MGTGIGADSTRASMGVAIAGSASATCAPDVDDEPESVVGVDDSLPLEQAVSSESAASTAVTRRAGCIIDRS